MSEWKRKLENVIAFIAGRLPWRGPATPKLIVRRILQAARREAEDWGHDQKKQAPNHYCVQINTEDWGQYFSKRKPELQERIARITYFNLNDKGYKIDGYTTVELSPSAALGEGRVKVYPSFLETQPFPEPVHGRSAKAPTNAPETVAQTKTASQSAGPTVRACVRTRRIPTATTATLRGGGREYEVRDGYRVGSGHGTHCAAEIELEGPGSEAISRDHGVFLHDGATWSFRNEGSNGTLVRRAGGEIERLEPGESCAVSNGDRLSFAHGADYLLIA